MKIFITGASGFVGGAAARSFKEQGHEIVAMSRSKHSDQVIEALGVKPVRCALGAVGARQLEGMDVIIHAAAKVEQWGAWPDFWRINVHGTRQLLDAAKKAGVASFIHIGTEAAVFYGQDMRDIDETVPLAFKSPYPYSRTKAYAEQAVLDASTADFRALCVRPRMIWGPDDKTILPIILDMIKSGRFMWIDGGRALTSTTHIANLVHGIDLALQKGRGGEAYFITDAGTRTLRDFITALTRTAGVTPPDKAIPGWAAGALAYTMETTWRLARLRSQPPLIRIAADMMRCEGTINTGKAQRELGYAPVVGFEDGLAALKSA